MNDSAPIASSSSSTAMLCAPALVYLVISFVALLMSWVQNMQNSNVYCAGHVSCPVQSTTYVFVLKIMWFLFWTWILNVLCTKGYKTVAWVLVAIPFLVFFTLMFGMANALTSGSSSSASAPASASSASSPSSSAHRENRMPAGGGNAMYVYGNKADKVAFYPNETNTQYSSYANYDANLDNRAKYLDRESKGLVQPQQPNSPR